jgi:hypothetical protein
MYSLDSECYLLDLTSAGYVIKILYTCQILLLLFQDLLRVLCISLVKGCESDVLIRNCAAPGLAVLVPVKFLILSVRLLTKLSTYVTTGPIKLKFLPVSDFTSYSLFIIAVPIPVPAKFYFIGSP